MKQRVRPASVLLFEIVSIVFALGNWMLSEQPSSLGYVLQTLVWIGLTLWVTRGQSRVARALYTGLLLFGSVGVVAFYLWGYISADALVAVALQAIAILVILLSLLWWPSTTAWLQGTHKPA